MDLAQGHVLALEHLSDECLSSVFTSSTKQNPEGKYKAYNLGKGQGMSVLDIVRAMEKATGREFKCEVIGRRYVSLPLPH